MNYLYFFTGLLLIIGFLLVITSFYAYSKLTSNCTVSSLKTKLRMSIALGSTLIATSIGFILCINDSTCNCSFSEITSAKTNMIIIFSIICGIILLILTVGIQSDLKKESCNVDLGVLPWFLGGIAVIQLLVSVLFIISIVFKKYKDSKESLEFKNVEEPDDGDSDKLVSEAESKQ